MEKKPENEIECSAFLLALEDAIDLLKGKWKAKILCALLYHETMTYTELEKAVNKITPKMLSKELKDLELNLLVTRKVSDKRPITVSYTITPHGKTCAPLMEELYNWGQRHRNFIMKSKRLSN